MTEEGSGGYWLFVVTATHVALAALITALAFEGTNVNSLSMAEIFFIFLWATPSLLVAYFIVRLMSFAFLLPFVPALLHRRFQEEDLLIDTKTGFISSRIGPSAEDRSPH